MTSVRGPQEINDGSDWINAYTSLPAYLTRGHTYYVADGSYGTYTFDDADSGTTYIYIKKATAADHGTETEWDSSYGDGSADWTYLDIQTNYLEIDGQVGQGASFFPDYVAYGIKVVRTTTADNQNSIRLGQSGQTKNHITLKHIEVSHGNTPRTGNLCGEDI